MFLRPGIFFEERRHRRRPTLLVWSAPWTQDHLGNIRMIFWFWVNTIIVIISAFLDDSVGRSLNIRYIAQPHSQMLIAPNSEPICPTLHSRNAELRQVFMIWSPIIVKTKNVECWFFSRKKDTFLHYLVSPSSRGVTGKIRVLPVAGVILPLLVLGDAHPLLTSHLDRHLLLTFQISNQPNMFFHIDWA